VKRVDSGRSGTRSGRDRATARRAAVAYGGAVEAVLAIGVGAGIGYWLDRSFETAPAFLLAGIVAGFGSFVLLIVRMTRKLAEISEDDATTSNEN
jgi:F0F1-type ATP synthase assembly protein I